MLQTLNVHMCVWVIFFITRGVEKRIHYSVATKQKLNYRTKDISGERMCIVKNRSVGRSANEKA